MQQSATGVVSYYQEQLNPNFESTCLLPQEAVSVLNRPDAKQKSIHQIYLKQAHIVNRNKSKAMSIYRFKLSSMMNRASYICVYQMDRDIIDS